MNRIVLILTLAALCTLSACASIPTSPRANEVRARVMPSVRTEMLTRGFAENSRLYLRGFKEEKIIEAWLQDPASGRYKLFETYPVCKFSGGLGPKTAEGDKKSPEGFYTITSQSLNPRSQYHLAFNVGYPNAYDRAHGRHGSLLMVHGDCVSVGCYALGDEAIERVYMLSENALRNGQREIPVHLFPFRMTPDNRARHNDTDWNGFWDELEPAYALFEQTRMPPEVRVEENAYVVTPAPPRSLLPLTDLALF